MDDQTHIGVGTGTTTPDPTDTDLETPVLRKAFDETPVKNVSAGTYDFSTTIGLTEANSNTLAEAGLFDALSGGNMSDHKLLTNTVAKTSSIELSIGIRLTVEVTNS